MLQEGLLDYYRLSVLFALCLTLSPWLPVCSEIAWKRSWVCPPVPVLVKRAENHIEHTQRAIYSPWSWSFRQRLPGFSAFKQLVSFYLELGGGGGGGVSLPPAVSTALSEHTESKTFPDKTTLQYWSTPHLILFCPLKHAFSHGWVLFKATQWDLCQWGSLTSFHNSGSPLGTKDGLLDHDMRGANRLARIGWKERRRGCRKKKVLRPGHSHLLLWWWASKPEGSLLGPSFRWSSYIWASYFTRTDSQ